MIGALSKRWGPKPKLVRWIYTAIVRPRLCYAAMVWSHSINQKNKIRKLMQINRLASMMMAPARRSTPTKALELINNLQPLEIFLHTQSIQAYNRQKSNYPLNWTGRNPKFPTLIGHRLFWLNLSYKMLRGIEITDVVNTKEPVKMYYIKIDNEKGRVKPKLAQINIFTDGSKTGQGTGAGLVIMKGSNTVIYNESIKLNDEATVFQAEAIAIEGTRG